VNGMKQLKYFIEEFGLFLAFMVVAIGAIWLIDAFGKFISTS